MTAALTIDPACSDHPTRLRRYNGVVTVNSAADRVVRELCRGAGGRAGQGEGRLAAADQEGADGQTRSGLGRNRAGAGDSLAQGRCRPGGQGRAHPDRRRGGRGRRLCGRVGHHRRVRARAEGAGHGHVLVGDRRHLVDFRLAARPRHRRSGRKLPRPHDPSRGRRQAAEDAERDGPDSPARHPDADLRHRGRPPWRRLRSICRPGSTSPI